MISGRSSETTYEQTEKRKPGKHLLGDGRAAEHVTAFEHQHLAPGAREIRRRGQAVVAAADDDRVDTAPRAYYRPTIMAAADTSES